MVVRLFDTFIEVKIRSIDRHQQSSIFHALKSSESNKIYHFSNILADWHCYASLNVKSEKRTK